MSILSGQKTTGIVAIQFYEGHMKRYALLTHTTMNGVENMPKGKGQIKAKACCLNTCKEVRKMNSDTKQIAW